MSSGAKLITAFLVACLWYLPARSQGDPNVVESYWSTANIACVEAKILSAPKLSLSPKSGEIGLWSGPVFGIKGAEDRITLTASSIESAIQGSPGLFGELMEALGGEFFVSGEPQPWESRMVNPQVGIRAGYILPGNLRLGIEFGYWNSELTSIFPVTVIEEGGTGTSSRTLQGEAMARIRGLDVLVDLTWFFPCPKILPFIGFGAGMGQVRIDDLRARIEDVRFRLPESYIDLVFSGQAHTGIRVPLYKGMCLDLQGTWRFRMNNEYELLHATEARVGLSYVFGP